MASYVLLYFWLGQEEELWTVYIAQEALDMNNVERNFTIMQQ